MRRDRTTQSGRQQPTAARGAAVGAPAMSRRAVIKTMGLAAAALAVPGAVAGCSSSSGGRISIRLEETKPEVIPYFNNLVAKFNASQRSISVTHDSASSLIAEFVRGNPPDIDCDNYNLTTSIFVARGVLANLAGLPQAKTIDPNIQALVTQYASY
jgi:raffinose/stachyose/melibiose transport system substrate-binding protein